jgi:GR25 family glycosyltransferase involved in LPS biosynthesis
MHTYCINLERRPDRKEIVSGEFDREGLDVEFFSATDGRAEAPSGVYISPSEYGCAMSHVRVWKDIVEKGYEFAMVCEDDVCLAPDFKTKLNELLDEVKHTPWDVMNLGPITPIIKTNVSNNLYEGQPLGTHAYVISLECAKKISVFEPKFMKVGIDFQLNRFPIMILCAREAIAKQECVDDSVFIGLLKSTIKGDIGLERTYDFTYLIRLCFQRFKPVIILLVLLIIFYALKYTAR